MRYFVEISNTDKDYTGFIHQGNPTSAQLLSNLKLGPDTEIIIKDQAYRFVALLQALIGYALNNRDLIFDERGQLEIGHYLYSQTLGQLPENERRRLHNADEVDIRIITQDEHIARLPWALLAYNGIFLSTTGWSVTLSGVTDLVDYELPPSPRLLVIAPQPDGILGTLAEQHLDALEDLLSAHDHLLTWDRHLKLVRTWEEFTRQVKTFEPQIVYYYGHGVGGMDRSRLVFADGANNQRYDAPVADFALQLRNLPNPPQLVYVNCCRGDAAGYLGVGKQLEAFVPAVVTNRTVAMVDAAQAQAMAFWENVLLRGIAPHQAVASLYSRMGDLNLSTADVRWLTPVLHCHYDHWRANPPTPPSRLAHDPHWHLKVDRVVQFSVVAEQTRQMLRERKPRTHAFVWYGQKNEGIETFHQRLNVGLRESLDNTFVYEVRPVWPLEFTQFHRSCQDMLTEAFSVNELQAIPARIRAKTAGASGKQTLVYMRHQPVASPKILNSENFQTYLEWWDNEFARLLEPNQFALLGVSFLVDNPTRFLDRMERLEQLELAMTTVRLLDQMEQLALKDLRDFLNTHNVRLPLQRREQVLKKILEKTDGHYDQTVEELKNLVSLAWDLSEEEPSRPKTEKDEEDW